MFECAWCKKENISPHKWSKDKEPICKRCSYKYNFAFRNDFIKGKVSDLTKSERRKISTEINYIKRFVEFTRMVRKEKLTGKFEFTRVFIGWLLVISVFVIYVLMGLEYKNTFFSGLFEIIFLLIYTVLIVLVYKKVFRLLQYLQIKKKVEGKK